jgi:predicted exporter
MSKPQLIKYSTSLLWLALMLACCGYSALKLSVGGAFESNILSLMPNSSATASDASSELQQQGQGKFVILISGASSQSGLAMAKALRDRLSKLADVGITDSTRELEQTLQEFYKPFRYQVLSSATRDLLLTKTPLELAELRLASLYSPLPDQSLYSFSDDPLNLSATWIESLLPGQGNLAAGEMLSVKDGTVTWYVVRGATDVSPFNLGLQQAFNIVISDFHRDNPEGALLTSGLLFHAAAGSEIARSEISTVGLGSILALVLLVGLVFRSLSKVSFILLVVICSTLTALTCTWLVFGQVHLVTLAFGSTLLGLAADYCFHFLVKVQASGNPQLARKAIFKGLAISAASSIAAYLFQLSSPFPGLQQFAVFIASGLAAAFFTVLVAADYFSNCEKAPIALGLVYEHCLKAQYRKISRHRGMFFAALGLVLLVCVGVIYKRGVSDDIRLLNTSGVELLASETKVKSLMGGFDIQRYFVIHGDSQEQVLQRTELLVDGLVGISNEPLETLSPALLIPSLARQESDYRLVQEKLFSPEGALPLLCRQLGGQCPWLDVLPSFNSQLTLTEFPSVLLSDFPMLSLLRQNSSVVLITSAVDLKSSSLPSAGITYVDQVKDLSGMLEGFRKQVSWILTGFICLLVGFSYWLFSAQALVIASSVITSSVIGLLLAAPGGITLFHVLALLLVVGIAIDTAVFFISPGLDRNTWAAATLACFTSIIAFGLLALSQVPILHQFGQVVFYGLLTAWVVTPTFRLLCGDMDETT